MASLDEVSGQLEGENPDISVSDHEPVSEHRGFSNAAQSDQPLSIVDQPTTAEAVLRILTAVEEIYSKLVAHSETPSSDENSKCDDESAASPRDVIEESIATQSGSCCPDIERLPMSSWSPPNFLPRESQRKRTSIIIGFYTEVPSTIRSAECCVSNADFKAAYSKDKWDLAPQRILIHSKEVMDELREITKIPDTQNTGVLAMVPPFKYLLPHRDAIKSRLDELKQESSHVGHALSTTESNVTNSDLSIRRLECIHEFIQTDLANYIGLEIKIQDGDIDEVSFQELYHLFKPGDLILGVLGKDQLHQVSSVTGGRKLLSWRPGGAGNYQQQREAHTRAGTWTSLRVAYFIMAWDGEHIGPVHSYFAIPYFPGTRRVTDLAAYPIQFRKDAGELRKRLCARGLKYVQCNGHKKYDGASVFPCGPLMAFCAKKKAVGGRDIRAKNSVGDEDGRFIPLEMVRGDVYIDYKSFYTQFFSTVPNLSFMAQFVSEDAEAIDSLRQGTTWNCSDHEVDSLLSGRFLSMNRHSIKYGRPENNPADDEARLQLVSSQIPAFVFSSRKWKWLDIDKIEDIDKSEESRRSGWKELVIPPKISELLLSLVSNHISDACVRHWENVSRHDSTLQIDLVRGKGRGLILLFHGPPGSGKTSTAETIAAYIGRPLYAITCGDLGNSPKALEKNIVRHTRRAEKWDCVLLLDEADVFLGSRTYDDRHRNAMVSVFLRHLEYYSGILFLTTNIVGVIDEAFKSRIHVALEYPAIDEDSTLEIWSRMLQRIKRDNEKAEMKILFDETALMRFAKRHYRSHRPNGSTWNGRQIRNAFQTAIGIGQYKRLQKIDQAVGQGKLPEKGLRHIRLTVASFETVAETTSNFERYIRKTRGDDRERAAAHEFRRDEHSSEPPPMKSYRTSPRMYRTDQDTVSSRVGRSRRYAEPSTSPGPRRTAKGKEVRRKARREARSASLSDSDEHTDRGGARRQSSDEESDEDIIEHDEDEYEDEDEGEDDDEDE